MVSILQKRTWAQSENVQAHDVRSELEVLQPQIKTSPNFQQMNKPYWIRSFFINLVVKNEEGGGGGAYGRSGTISLGFTRRMKMLPASPFPPLFKKATLNFRYVLRVQNHLLVVDFACNHHFIKINYKRRMQLIKKMRISQSDLNVEWYKKFPALALQSC